MKKIITLLVLMLIMSCSVDDPVQPRNLDELNYSSQEDCTLSAGPDNSLTVEQSTAASIESWDEVRKLYLSLLAKDVSRNGTFSPSIWDLIDQFKEDPLGDFTTTYTVSDGSCTDSALLTVTVIPDQQQDPTCLGMAGPDNSKTITQSEASAIESWDEVRKLYLSLLADGVSRNATFNPTIWDLIHQYEQEPLGDFSTICTITDGDCSDSVLLTISVIADEQDPVCVGVDAGEDKLIEMSQSEAAAIESWDEVRKLYLSLLDSGVPRDGSFDPSIWDLINAFNSTNNPIGDYSTTYTIKKDNCTDSVQLTVRVVPD